MAREEKDPRTHAIIGAAMEVHRILGHGFLEPVYQKAMEVELGLRAIPFIPQPYVPVMYKGIKLDEVFYRPDLICYDSIIVELKALSDMGGVEDSQVINYLKATGKTVGLLLSFGRGSLQFKRFVRSVPAFESNG